MKAVLKFCLIPLLLHALTVHAAITVTNLAQGGLALHSVFLKSDGSLWAMGLDQYGELGDGTNYSGYYTTNSIEYNFPQHPEEIVASNVTAAAAGGYHTLFIGTNGSLWAMGFNGFGQLGDNSSDHGLYYANQPEEILSNGVMAIAAGAYHSLFLETNGSLWGMGDNTEGQLGDGKDTSSQAPEQIVVSNVTAIAAGEYFSLFLKSDGSLWALGDNSYGQFGNGTNSVGTYTNLAEQVLPPGSGITAIAAGQAHSLLLKSDGSLWGMGWNDYAQLGDGTYNNTNLPELIVPGGVAKMAAGAVQSLFIQTNGSLWAMGLGYYGEVGDGNNLDAKLPVQIVPGGVTAIAAAQWTSLYVLSDGSLWATGNNEYGQLGDGFIDNIFFAGIDTPEQIVPEPQPVLSTTLASPTNLQINGNCGFAGTYYLLGSTNLRLPRSQWTPLGTNAVIMRGPGNYSVTLTNAVVPAGQAFYMLESQ